MKQTNDDQANKSGSEEVSQLCVHFYYDGNDKAGGEYGVKYTKGIRRRERYESKDRLVQKSGRNILSVLEKRTM